MQGNDLGMQLGVNVDKPMALYMQPMELDLQLVKLDMQPVKLDMQPPIWICRLYIPQSWICNSSS
jgi:hypothetical protein